MMTSEGLGWAALSQLNIWRAAFCIWAGHSYHQRPHSGSLKISVLINILKVAHNHNLQITLRNYFFLFPM
jgi:hypothetical protein